MKKYRSVITTILLVLGVINYCYCDVNPEGKIVVKIFDKKTKEPIPNVELQLDHIDGETESIIAFTEPGRDLYIGGIKAGVYSALAKAQGYEDFRADGIEVEEGEIVPIDLAMTLKNCLPHPFGNLKKYSSIPMTVLAQVTIDEIPADSGAIVGAFVGDELRGNSTVFEKDGLGLVNLTIENQGNDELIHFKVWDCSQNILAQSPKTIATTVGGIMGAFPNELHPIAVRSDVDIGIDSMPNLRMDEIPLAFNDGTYSYIDLFEMQAQVPHADWRDNDNDGFDLNYLSEASHADWRDNDNDGFNLNYLSEASHADWKDNDNDGFDLNYFSKVHFTMECFTCLSPDFGKSNILFKVMVRNLNHLQTPFNYKLTHSKSNKTKREVKNLKSGPSPFAIIRLPSGTYDLTILADGYSEKVVEKINVTNDTIDIGSIELIPEPAQSHRSELTEPISILYNSEPVSGIPVSVSYHRNGNRTNDEYLTDFSIEIDAATELELTAPLEYSVNGYSFEFDRWKVNGSYLEPLENSLSLKGDKHIEVEAIYGPRNVILQKLALQEGWNAVSFHVNLIGRSITEVMGNQLEHIDRIASGLFSFSPARPEFFNTLNEFKPGQAYFFKMNSVAELSILAEAVDPMEFEISLKKGWNAFGVIHPDPISIVENLSYLLPKVEKIIGNNSNFSPNQPRELNTLSKLIPGAVYWIKMIDEDVLHFQEILDAESVVKAATISEPVYEDFKIGDTTSLTNSQGN